MRRLLAVISSLTVTVLACLPQGQCDQQFAEYCKPGDPLCQGRLIDAHTWESGPIEGTWVDFARNKTVRMHFRDAVTGQALQGSILSFSGAVSATPRPNDPGNQLAGCAGNLCEVSNMTSDGSGLEADVQNGTCADYFIHFVVTSEPAADASPD
jgi:hypothetical protein